MTTVTLSTQPQCDNISLVELQTDNMDQDQVPGQQEVLSKCNFISTHNTGCALGASKNVDLAACDIHASVMVPHVSRQE